jgi:hypothetical protein
VKERVAEFPWDAILWSPTVCLVETKLFLRITRARLLPTVGIRLFAPTLALALVDAGAVTMSLPDVSGKGFDASKATLFVRSASCYVLPFSGLLYFLSLKFTVLSREADAVPA